MAYVLGPVDESLCTRIKCGAVAQSEVPLETLLACSQQYGPGVYGACSPPCAPYAAEIAAKLGMICGPAPGAAVSAAPVTVLAQGAPISYEPYSGGMNSRWPSCDCKPKQKACQCNGGLGELPAAGGLAPLVAIAAGLVFLFWPRRARR